MPSSWSVVASPDAGSGACRNDAGGRGRAGCLVAGQSWHPLTQGQGRAGMMLEGEGAQDAQ
jgi:hypothetical protein